MSGSHSNPHINQGCARKKQGRDAHKGGAKFAAALGLKTGMSPWCRIATLASSCNPIQKNPLPWTPSPGNKTQGNLERLNKNIPFVSDVWSWTPSRKEN